MRAKFFITLSIFLLVEIALIGSFAYLWLFMIQPLSGMFEEVQRKTKIAEEQIVFFTQVVEPDLTRDNEEFRQIKEMFFDSDGKNAFDIVLYIEGVAQKHNVKATFSKPPGGTPPAGDVLVTGSIQNILPFLREIENGAYLLNIKEVSVERASTNITFNLASL